MSSTSDSLAVKRRELLAKRKPVDTLDASVLADRQEYWRLLHEYDKDAAVLPEDEQGKGRKADKPPEPEMLEAEITTLQDLALPTIEVPDTDLADLGRRVRKRFRTCCSSAGDIEPAGFSSSMPARAPIEGELVRMELSMR